MISVPHTKEELGIGLTDVSYDRWIIRNIRAVQSIIEGSYYCNQPIVYRESFDIDFKMSVADDRYPLSYFPLHAINSLQYKCELGDDEWTDVEEPYLQKFKDIYWVGKSGGKLGTYFCRANVSVGYVNLDAYRITGDTIPTGIPAMPADIIDVATEMMYTLWNDREHNQYGLKSKAESLSGANSSATTTFYTKSEKASWWQKQLSTHTRVEVI